MLSKSFRSVVQGAFPTANARKLALVALAVAAGATACGGSSNAAENTRLVAGVGFRFQAPADWKVKRRVRLVEARDGGALVSVALARLPRPFKDSLWDRVVPEIDARARELGAATGASLESSATARIAGRRGRVYELERNGTARRLGFVLVGRREYVLYCRNAGDACDTLFDTFTLG